MASQNLAPSYHDSNSSTVNRLNLASRHVVRLKQCTTASIVSRMLNDGGKFTIPNQLKSHPLKTDVGSSLTVSRLKENPSGSTSRRSGVIELSYSGAEKTMEPGRIRQVDPILSPRIRIEGLVDQVQRNGHVTSRRHFRIDAVNSRLDHSRLSCTKLLKNSIDFVKSTVDMALVTDIEIAEKNAGIS
jgi:hypothetical protein